MHALAAAVLVGSWSPEAAVPDPPPPQDADEVEMVAPPAESGDAPTPRAAPDEPGCQRADFETFEEFVDCRANAEGLPGEPVAPLEPATPPAEMTETVETTRSRLPKLNRIGGWAPRDRDANRLPSRPATPWELRNLRQLRIAGGVTLGVGLGSWVSAASLLAVANRASYRVASGASPGQLGFPDEYWHDLADDARLTHRADLASIVLAGVGTAAVVAGITILATASWRRRRFAMRFEPGRTVARW